MLGLGIETLARFIIPAMELWSVKANKWIGQIRRNGHGWPYPFLATSLETSLSQQELSIAANLPSFVTSREEELGIQKVWITLTGPVKA
jgi:hypothetical protein